MDVPRDERSSPFLTRHATPLQVLLTLGLYVQLAILAGLATSPGVYLAVRAWPTISSLPLPLRVVAACCMGWCVFFSYAISVVLVVGAFRFVTRGGTPLGRFPFYSFKAYQWASYNALTLLVRYTCINFLRVTPFIVLLHRLMGMKVGRRVQINTAIIGDANLIEIGDDTVIGGDVTLVAHSAERGAIVTAPVRIGSRVTVGLMTVIFPGVTIEDDAVIAANAILPKGTRVGRGEVWGGVPARKIGERDLSKRAPDADR
jgi:acetyltransferase-like isoleucine patch superfamily enzyme